MTVRCEGVSFRYDGGGVDALRDVTVEFAPGGLHLVTGRLGAGCSTLLFAIAGLAPHVTGGARSGSVITLGQDPATEEGRRTLAGRVGLLLPTPWTQLSGMAHTVADEVAFGPANLGWERGRIREAVRAALQLVDLEHLAGRDPRSLSGGELQRVMFAGIAAMDPDVYLLDEPVMELEPEAASLMYRHLPELARRKTVIVATTDLDRAVSVADRIVLLEAGHVVADGDPERVLGTARAVEAGASTSVARIAYLAGAPHPLPLTPSAAVARFAR